MGNQQPKLVASLPTVIVIGGGYGGRAAAQVLDASGKVNVIVLERKDYAFHNIGASRAAVEPNFQKHLIAPYTHFLRNGAVIEATVSHIDIQNKTVSVDGYAQPISYNYLVIATGSSYPFPAKAEDPQAYQAYAKFASFQQHIKNAKRIAIIGGGPVGIELAGEIATDLPDKDVTLIHAHSALLDDSLSPVLREECKIQLERLKVKVILNERIHLESKQEEKKWESYLVEERELVTSQGTIHADLILMATGTRINRDAWKDTLPIAEDGRIKVNRYLQVDGTLEAYAIGDAASIGRKLAYYAGLHGQHAAKNILAQVQQKPLIPYKGDGLAALFVSIGRKGGAGQFPNAKATIVRSCIVGMIKSKTMMADKHWSSLKANPSAVPVPSAPHYSAPSTSDLPETRIRNVAAALQLNDPQQAQSILQKGITAV